MTRAWLRRAVLISVVTAALFAIVRAVRGPAVPAFEPPGGAGAPWPTLRPEPAPDWVGPAAAPVDAPPAAVDAPPAADDTEVDVAVAWLTATDGPVPATHPVKAKLSSGIYHLPGMQNYERTHADRFYRTAEDAEADGLRVAKR